MAKESKYGNVTVEKGNIPADEPVFLFRAQDKLASMVIRHYADMRQRDGDAEAASRIRKEADAMDKWPVKKDPDD